MRIDANLMDPSLTRVDEYARTAEQMGFDGAWVTELTHSPYTLLTRAAAATETLSVGSAISLAFPRSPMVSAYTAWDIQRLSEGRFILGLGTQVKGHIERRFGMDWDAPGPWIREYILALREIWQAWREHREPEFQGEHYSITLCPPKFRPDPPSKSEVPIYLAGVNEFNVRLAGELCEGLHVHPFHTPGYVREEVIPNVRAGTEAADRDIEDVTLATSVFAIVGDSAADRERSREAVRERLAFYGSTRTYRNIMEVHGWEELSDQLHSLSTNDEWEQMAQLIPDEMVDAFTVEGTWPELTDRIHDRYDYIDRVAIYAPFAGESHWRHVVP